MNLGDRRAPPPGARREGPPGQAAARLLQMKPGESRGAPGPSRRREDDKIRTPSEERRREERRERRRKEKEEGLKDSQGRPVPSSSGRSKRRGPHLDPIDKLDTTGAFLFGGGMHTPPSTCTELTLQATTFPGLTMRLCPNTPKASMLPSTLLPRTV